MKFFVIRFHFGRLSERSGLVPLTPSLDNLNDVRFVVCRITNRVPSPHRLLYASEANEQTFRCFLESTDSQTPLKYSHYHLDHQTRPSELSHC